MRFTNHYNTTAICMASRASVLTGLYEYRHGCNFEHGDLERRFIEQSYPVRLRQAGYFTGFAGKIGFVLQGEKFDALAPLFDAWAGGPGQTLYETAKNEGIAKYADKYPHCSRAYGAWAQDFLKSAKTSGKPFCMSISFKAPHLPFTPDPIDLKLYEGKTFTRPPNYGVENAKHLSPQSQTSRAATGYREWVTDYDDTAAKYYALITGVDAAVGHDPRGTGRARGWTRTRSSFSPPTTATTPARTASATKCSPMRKARSHRSSSTIRACPKNGKTCEAITGNVDMAATIFALSGEAAPEGIDGKSLLPLLRIPRTGARCAAALQFLGRGSAQSMAVVTPEWKYIYWYYGDGMKPTEELFHVGNDRYEMTNSVANKNYAATLAKMRAHYDIELAAIAPNLAREHGYESYPTLFSRTIPWAQKAGLIKGLKVGGGEGKGGTAEKPKKKGKANQ